MTLLPQEGEYAVPGRRAAVCVLVMVVGLLGLYYRSRVQRNTEQDFIKMEYRHQEHTDADKVCVIDTLSFCDDQSRNSGHLQRWWRLFQSLQLLGDPTHSVCALTAAVKIVMWCHALLHFLNQGPWLTFWFVSLAQNCENKYIVQRWNLNFLLHYLICSW